MHINSFVRYLKDDRTVIGFSFLLLIFSILIQFICFNEALFFRDVFNGDESEYHEAIENSASLYELLFSGSLPYLVPSYIFHKLFDVTFPNRYISLLSFVFISIYVFRNIRLYIRGHRLVFFGLIFVFVLISLRQMFIGTSDFLATVLCFIGLVEFDKIKFMMIKTKNYIYGLMSSGLFLGLSVMTRPTVIICIIIFIITYNILQKQYSFIKTSLFVTIFTLLVVFTLSIPNISVGNGVKLDIKNIPSNVSTSWFEMNYLMAVHWNDGTLSRDKWYSAEDVVQFKKENTDFYFPSNHFDILLNNPTLYFKVLPIELARGLYSVILYSAGLIFCYFSISYGRFKSLVDAKMAKESVYLIFSCIVLILIFSFLSVKLFEFRWIHVFYLLLLYKVIIYILKHMVNKYSVFLFISTYCICFTIYTYVRLFC